MCRYMSEVFLAKQYYKVSESLILQVTFFASFYWLWDFLLENLKIVDKIQIGGF